MSLVWRRSHASETPRQLNDLMLCDDEAVGAGGAWVSDWLADAPFYIGSLCLSVKTDFVYTLWLYFGSIADSGVVGHSGVSRHNLAASEAAGTRWFFIGGPGQELPGIRAAGFLFHIYNVSASPGIIDFMELWYVA